LIREQIDPQLDVLQVRDSSEVAEFWACLAKVSAAELVSLLILNSWASIVLVITTGRGLFAEG